MTDSSAKDNASPEKQQAVSTHLFLSGLDTRYTGATRAFVLRNRKKTRAKDVPPNKRATKFAPLKRDRNTRQATGPKQDIRKMNCHPNFDMEESRSIQYFFERISPQMASHFDKVIVFKPPVFQPFSKEPGLLASGDLSGQRS
jgi:hypothetical protein